MRRLNVGFNGGAFEGVFAVLLAAAMLHVKDKAGKAGAAAGGGLQQLSVAGAAVGADQAAQLATLLAPLVTLEEVNVAGLGLHGNGVRSVLRGLPGLHQLRGVNLLDKWAERGRRCGGRPAARCGDWPETAGHARGDGGGQGGCEVGGGAGRAGGVCGDTVTHAA